MTNNVIQGSFASGELSPSLFARVDLAKYKTGLALARNVFVDYRGGVSNRAGTEFVGRRKLNSTGRLIKFQFSTIQEYILEFGDYYLRIISDGGYILESAYAISGITQASPGVVTAAGHDFAAGDEIYITGLDGMTPLNGGNYLVGSVGSGTFTLETLDGVAIDTTNFPAYVSGGTAARVYTLVTPYAATDLALLKYTQNADVMTLTHPSYVPRDLGRVAQDNWTLTEITFASSVAAPTGTSAVASATGGATYSYQITAIGPNGDESYPSVAATITDAVDITTTAGTVAVSWSPVPGAISYNVYKIMVGVNGGGGFYPPAAVPIPVGSLYGFAGQSFGLQLIDNNITPDFTKTPPIHGDPFAPGAITQVNPTATGTDYTSNPTVTITDVTGSGAVVYPILLNGEIQGYYIDRAGSNYSSPTVSLSGGGGSGATAVAVIGPTSGTYPGSCGYFQQRKVFAASDNAPDTVWATQPGSFSNMDVSNPVRDDNALQLALAAQQVNNIRSMITMPSGLVLLTSGGAWQLSGGGQSAAVTPASAIATPQAYNGCSELPPLVINYDIVYVQAKGSVIRDLSYNFYVNIYTGTDISVLASHLLTGYELLEWDYAEEPYKIIWIVRDDGQLLGFTYLKEQDVYAFTHSDTLGRFKSVAVITENNLSSVYVIVERKIGDQLLSYVERLHNRLMPAGVEDAWFVDCALSNTPNYAAAGLTIAASSGSGVSAVADTAVFSSDDVGKVVRAGGGTATVATYVSTTEITLNITRPITSVYPNGVPYPVDSGAWTLDATFTTFSGLSHLEGQTVSIFGDGSVFPQQTVTDGAVTLSQPVSKIVVGLPFTAQIQTLRLDVGEPTIQGKRKKIAALTTRYLDSRGIKVGHSFDDLTELKPETPVAWGVPAELESGDRYQILPPLWDTEGQLCLQQDLPLPMTILGVIPEVIGGDNSQG